MGLLASGFMIAVSLLVFFTEDNLDIIDYFLILGAPPTLGALFSPFKVVLLFFSTRNDFSRRDMRRIFATAPFGLWFFGTSRMLSKGG